MIGTADEVFHTNTPIRGHRKNYGAVYDEE